jgi:NDP-sugar pyrophosphorylase family protein
MFNMPDLIRRACRDGRRVGVFPLREPFHEIGRVDSYREAEAFYQSHFAADVQGKTDR